MTAADGPVLPSPPATSRRLDAIDLVRGLVIVLMAVDHSSGAFNAGRVTSDAAMSYKPGTPLPEAQFFTRWMTHLCAPTFVFLAGASLALSVARQRAQGVPGRVIDRFIVTRGLVVIALELVPSSFWMDWGVILFQVLYAIGSSMVLMALVRRLPVPALLALALVVVGLAEAVDGALAIDPPHHAPLLLSLLLVFGHFDHLVVAYPTLPWLAILLLGWVFGTWLASRPPVARIQRALVAISLVFLGTFALVRGENGYGNFHLLRDDGSLVQWLHVSKYPPSLSYTALELGLALLLLAGAFVLGPSSPKNPLLVFGRTPLLFYVLHIPLLNALARGTGLYHHAGLGATYGFALVAVVLLYPLCLMYGRYKAAHPDGFVRYL